MFTQKRVLSTLCILIVSFSLFSSAINASPHAPVTTEDALILLLYPEVAKAVHDYYKDYISDGPNVAPYSIDLKSLSHTPNEEGAYHYTITLETRPYVGAHVDVGLDRITFSISLNVIDSVVLEHLESQTLPPWLQHHIIKSLP